MALDWRSPLAFEDGLSTWRGEVLWYRQPVDVRCYCEDMGKKKPGDRPPSKQLATIERQLESRVTACEADIKQALTPLADRWNSQWRGDAEKEKTSSVIAKRLSLVMCSLYQGEQSGAYLAMFDAGELFGGYLVQLMSDGQHVTGMRLQPPVGPDGMKRLLPNLPQKKSIISLPTTVATGEKTPPKIASTSRRAKLSWAKPLSFDRKQKAWVGSLAIRSREIDVKADAPTSSQPPA